MHGAAIAAAFRALSADHLEFVDEAGIEAMARCPHRGGAAAGRVLFPARDALAAARSAAPARHRRWLSPRTAIPGTSPLTSPADGHEHGGDAVSHDGGRVPHRRHARGRAGARPGTTAVARSKPANNAISPSGMSSVRRSWSIAIGLQSAARARMERRMNAPAHHEWLAIHHGDAPLLVSFPHTGIEIPADIESNLVSPWLARKDADYWVDVLYDFAHEMGATTLRTALSRTVIDVNRDPSGASLYPGQATTGLCPTRDLRRRTAVQARTRTGRCGNRPPPRRVLRPLSRRTSTPELRAAARAPRARRAVSTRIRSARACRDCSTATLPQFNIGTNNGASCDAALTARVEKICEASSFDQRHQRPLPRRLDHAPLWQARKRHSCVQMELAMRGYLHEPEDHSPNKLARAARRRACRHAARRAARYSRYLRQISRLVQSP